MLKVKKKEENESHLKSYCLRDFKIVNTLESLFFLCRGFFLS